MSFFVCGSGQNRLFLVAEFPPQHHRADQRDAEDIGTDAGLTKHLSFAMCRWTCFVKDYAEGVPMEVIRDKMGVSQVQWRDIYNKLQILLPIWRQTILALHNNDNASPQMVARASQAQDQLKQALQQLLRTSGEPA